jgi:hypothetical protein
MDQTAEVRTGISRHNQGLDPDDLNKTATGVNLIQQAAAQRVELIARIFAFSVQKAVRGILGLIKRHAQQERIIRVSGAPLQTDPAMEERHDRLRQCRARHRQSRPNHLAADGAAECAAADCHDPAGYVRAVGFCEKHL